MPKKKVLIITQEMNPYTAISEISEIARRLPQYVQQKGMEIRVLMPKFGTINERRHRLHEVVRLSGMNIIVDDDDFPLIIKVASLPGARMQVYFLDNEDFFRRKSVFTDDEGEVFDDNEDRMVFFCKGAIETVKKFGWPPDIIHCHGWMTSLIPLYIKKAYKNEPLFRDAKVIYSMYENPLTDNFSDDFFAKASINALNEGDLKAYKINDKIVADRGAATFADGIIVGSESLTESVKEMLEGLEVPVLEYPGAEKEAYLPAYLEFFKSFLEQKEEA
jgi:starch synthase